MVPALKPRSWPSSGTAKMCTSQHIDNNQFTANRRLKPGRRNRSQAFCVAGSAAIGRPGCRGTCVAVISEAKGISNSAR